MGQVVLVTGVAGDLGRRFAAQLSKSSAVERVIGIDTVPPRGDLGQADFVRADIRNPVIAKVIVRERVDTVVHTSVNATPAAAGGRTSMKELNVIGTMQLLAACQQAPDVRKLVLKSSAAVYGASNRDPAMFTEGMNAKRLATSGFAKDITEVESYTRGFARRRPDVAVTTLRIANVIGPTDHLGDDRLLPAARDPDGARLQPPAAVPPRAGRPRRARARHRHRGDRHLQHRRRRRSSLSPRPYAASAARRSRCPASPSPPSARRSGRRGAPTSRPSRWPS